MIQAEMYVSIDAEAVFDSLCSHEQEVLMKHNFEQMPNAIQKTFLRWLFQNYDDLIDEINRLSNETDN